MGTIVTVHLREGDNIKLYKNKDSLGTAYFELTFGSPADSVTVYLNPRDAVRLKHLIDKGVKHAKHK